MHAWHSKNEKLYKPSLNRFYAFDPDKLTSIKFTFSPQMWKTALRYDSNKTLIVMSSDFPHLKEGRVTQIDFYVPAKDCRAWAIIMVVKSYISLNDYTSRLMRL